MKTEKDGIKKFSDLRKRAQNFLSGPTKAPIPLMSQEAVKQLVHELDTYQIELELQNEDLRHAQQEISLARNRFSDLYDFAPVGYLTISDKGVILESNLNATVMLGVERGLLLQQPFSSFIAADDQDIYYRFRKKIFDKKSSNMQTCEVRMCRKDRSLFHVRLKGAFSPQVDGISGQFRIIIIDITEQKELERALVLGKKEWEKTFDAMGDIVTLMDKDLRIVRANKTAHDFFEVKPGGLNGQYCYEIFRGVSSPCPNCPLINTLKNEIYPCSECIEHNSLKKIFLVSSAPILDENGELQRLVHVAKDITDTKKLEEQLFEAHKMEAIGTLAGGIAHDFNNILSAILGYSELIKEDISITGDLKEYNAQVLKAALRAKELVKQILAFSRKKHGQQNQLLFPHTVVKEALKMMRASLPKTIDLHEDVDQHCSAILVDPTQFYQVVVNLCTNAFQAIENQQGTISVHLSDYNLSEEEVNGELNVSPGVFVELVVGDTGRGIDKKVIDHIFEPYFTTKGVGKGSGIGLAVVHGIIKSYGGMVRVESEVGKGATFKIYFPATIEKQNHKEEGPKKKSLPTGSEHVLVVDDEEVIVAYMKACMEDLGYTVTAHTQSIAAFEDFISRPGEFDLVITDQTMPKMAGVELSQKMMTARPDIPIIVMTGYSSMLSEEKAEKLGVKRLVMKPIQRGELAHLIREVLDEGLSK